MAKHENDIRNGKQDEAASQPELPPLPWWNTKTRHLFRFGEKSNLIVADSEARGDEGTWSRTKYGVVYEPAHGEPGIEVSDWGLEAISEQRATVDLVDAGASSPTIFVKVKGAEPQNLLKVSMFGNRLFPEQLQRKVAFAIRLMKYGIDVREGRRTGTADMLKVLFKDSPIK